MSSPRYQEYLSSDEWKRKKAMVISRDHGTCQQCGIKATLEVHHLIYDRIGEELTSDLISLCSTCHKQVHSDRIEDRGKWNKYITSITDEKPINQSELTPNELYEHRIKMMKDYI